jgi:hypothetical protein
MFRGVTPVMTAVMADRSTWTCARARRPRARSRLLRDIAAVRGHRRSSAGDATRRGAGGTGRAQRWRWLAAARRRRRSRTASRPRGAVTAPATAVGASRRRDDRCAPRQDRARPSGSNSGRSAPHGGVRPPRRITAACAVTSAVCAPPWSRRVPPGDPAAAHRLARRHVSPRCAPGRWVLRVGSPRRQPSAWHRCRNRDGPGPAGQ